ncbi:MAG: YceI family protein [Cytophagales bacterium]|nr:YceI family protein [Cytophagales bacterium]
MMKMIRVSMTALALLLLSHTGPLVAGGNPGAGTQPAETPAKAATLPVDVSKSTMQWTAKKVTGQHNGTVKLAGGTLQVKGNKLTGGTFSMDMTTITVSDITDASGNAKLTGHLKSEDFFSVEKHPASTFTLTKAAPIAGAKAGEPNYTLTGNLTIKGITNPVTFPATVKISGNAAEATARLDVDRTKWDIKYRAAIIGTVADKVIEDNFTIDLKIVAGKSETASR